MDGKGDAEDETPRRQWGRPGSTILNVLKQAPLKEGTVTMASDKSGMCHHRLDVCHFLRKV